MGTRNIEATDDYSWSICVLPKCDRTFLLFHCHSYTSSETSNVYGKPIYVEALTSDKVWKFPRREIFGKVFYDISKVVCGGIHHNLHDTAICSVFNRLIGRDITEKTNLAFCKLLSVPIDCVRDTISPYSVLAGILSANKRVSEGLHALADLLGISVNDCGITGSWALGCNRKESDIDVVVRLAPHEAKPFMSKVAALKKDAEGALLRDKFGYMWPLRIKLFSYEWCIFVTYRALGESILWGAELTRSGRSIPIEGNVCEDSHSLFCPTVLEIQKEAGKTFYVVFPSTEARGVFHEGDYIEAFGIPCLWKSVGEIALRDRLAYVVVDGIKTCKSLLKKLLNNNE
jgi:predicted nucleotidyltransferase